LLCQWILRGNFVSFEEKCGEKLSKRHIWKAKRQFEEDFVSYPVSTNQIKINIIDDEIIDDEIIDDEGHLLLFYILPLFTRNTK